MINREVWNALPGDKIRTVESENFEEYGDPHPNAHGERADAIKHLKPDTIYTVLYTEDYGWSSVVVLQEFPNIRFNSIFFEEIV